MSRLRQYQASGDCPATSQDECATMRERSVAGRSDVIPACGVHGEPDPDDYLYAESLGDSPDCHASPVGYVPARFRLVVANADGSEEEIVDDNLNLVEFLHVNDDADFTGEDMVSILTLQPGASWTGGGGAAPLFRIERVR